MTALPKTDDAFGIADNGTIRDLISLCTALIRLMRQETQCLKAMNPSAIAKLQDQKSALALSYHEQVRQLAGEPRCLQAVEPVLRDELKREMAALAEEVTLNERALRAARNANERVLQLIADAVSATRTKHDTYGRDGAPRAEARVGEKPVALSVDRRL